MALPNPSRFTVGALNDEIGTSLVDLRAGFRNGYVFELRHELSPMALMVHVLVLNPRVYNLSEPFQETLTPSEDNTVVSEENGIIVREITLEGTFGLSDKRATGFLGVQGNGAPFSGNEHFMALRRMFRTYSELKKGPDSAYYKLIFHCLKDDDHYVVVPRTFDTPRDARTTRSHYDYRIVLAAVAEAANTLRPIPVDDGLDFFTNALASIAEAFNDARSFFAELTATLATIKRKVGNIQAVMINAGALLNAVGNALRAMGELIRYPFQMAVTVLDQIDSAIDEFVTSAMSVTRVDEDIERSMRKMSASIDRICQFPNFFDFGEEKKIADVKQQYLCEQAMTVQDTEEMTAGATVGTKTRLSTGSAKKAGLNLGDYKGIIRVTVDRTMSIQSLSVAYNVPPELIVIVNDLRFPYLSEAGGPGLKAPGDEILIPARVALNVVATSPPPPDYLTAEEAMYGIDMALDPVVLAKEGLFEIKEDTTRDLLDCQLIRGIPNVVQGTEITVRTDRGSTVFLPDIGIRRSVGIKGTLQHVLLTALNLREAILLDPRIESIQDSRVVLNGDVLTQEISPKLIGEKSGVTLVLPFGRSSGGA